jgi:ATP-binding cassette subfamily B protein
MSSQEEVDQRGTSPEFKFSRTIAEFVKSHPGLVGGSLLLALVMTPLSDILLPHTYGQLITLFQESTRGASNGISWGSLKVPLVYLVTTLVLVQVGGLIKDALDTRMQPLLFDYIKTSMVTAILEKYDGRFIEPNTGQIVSKIVRTPDIVAYWLSSSIQYLLPQVLTFFYGIVYLANYDAVLSLAMVVMGLLITGLLFWSPVYCMRKARRAEQLLDGVHEDIEDVMRNMVSVYSTDSGPMEIASLGRGGRDYMRASMDAMSCLFRFKAMGMPLIVSFTVLVVLRGCFLVKEGRIKTGAFVSIFMLTTTFVATFMWLISIIRNTTLDVGTLVEAREMLNRSSAEESPREIPPRILTDSNPPRKDGLGFWGVSFWHGSNSQVAIFRDLTVHFEAGQRTVITGTIGSGKSTLVKLIMALVQPQQGDLYISGRWYRDVSARDVRRSIGYMPQEATLFDRSILENVIYGIPGMSPDDPNVATSIEAKMRGLGLFDEFADMEDGLLTRVQKNGSRLSGGQRQLVWFMRLIVRDAPVLIMDEPTAAMDAKTKLAFLRALDRISSGGPPPRDPGSSSGPKTASQQQQQKTIIMITHDEDLLGIATRRIHLERDSSS